VDRDAALNVVWQGLDAPRLEIARIERRDAPMRATGTQLGVAYELRYALDGDELRLELVGEHETSVALDGCDFFDLGHSPLFNSLPVWRDGLLEAGPSREYVMRWVSVPDLEVEESPQVYEPLGGGAVRFRSGTFAADIAFDAEGIVRRYEGLAERVG
jgi:hypothetical protein